jgi:diaminopimelate dehydrogenase
VKRIRVAIIGFGKLGRACVRAIGDFQRLELAGIVRRLESLSPDQPETLFDTPVVAHIRELDRVDGVLVCVPSEAVLGTALELLQQGIPIVECAALPGDVLEGHWHEIDRVAAHHGVAAIVGAGWNPGAMTKLCSLFARLIPSGHTEISHRPGVGLHHTALQAEISGLVAALSAEVRASDGSRQRYVYAEVEPGADAEQVTAAIRQDPMFLGEETLVFPVDSVTDLEQESHGVVIERIGAGACVHQTLLLETRSAATPFAARMMLEATCTLTKRRPGAYRYPEEC